MAGILKPEFARGGEWVRAVATPRGWGGQGGAIGAGEAGRTAQVDLALLQGVHELRRTRDQLHGKADHG